MSVTAKAEMLKNALGCATQEELADLTGVSLRTVGRWFAGQVPSRAHQKVLARCYGSPPETVFRFFDSPDATLPMRTVAPDRKHNGVAHDYVVDALVDREVTQWLNEADIRRAQLCLRALIFDDLLTEEERRCLDEQAIVEGLRMERRRSQGQNRDFRGVLARVLHSLGRDAIERLLQHAEEGGRDAD